MTDICYLKVVQNLFLCLVKEKKKLTQIFCPESMEMEIAIDRYVALGWYSFNLTCNLPHSAKNSETARK